MKDLPHASSIGGRSQSRPFPARAEKVMESAGDLQRTTNGCAAQSERDEWPVSPEGHAAEFGADGQSAALGGAAGVASAEYSHPSAPIDLRKEVEFLRSQRDQLLVQNQWLRNQLNTLSRGRIAEPSPDLASLPTEKPLTSSCIPANGSPAASPHPSPRVPAMCCVCKRMYNERGQYVTVPAWQRPERWSHGYCPECFIEAQAEAHAYLRSLVLPKSVEEVL